MNPTEMTEVDKLLDTKKQTLYGDLSGVVSKRVGKLLKVPEAVAVAAFVESEWKKGEGNKDYEDALTADTLLQGIGVTSADVPPDVAWKLHQALDSVAQREIETRGKDPAQRPHVDAAITLRGLAHKDAVEKYGQRQVGVLGSLPQAWAPAWVQRVLPLR